MFDRIMDSTMGGLILLVAVLGVLRTAGLV